MLNNGLAMYGKLISKWFSAIFVVVGLAVIGPRIFKTDFRKVLSEESLLREFKQIKKPEGTVELTSIRRGSKGVLVFVAQDLQSSLDEGDLLEYYDLELQENSWTQSKSWVASTGRTIVRYCKPHLDATIELSGASGSSSAYYFGVRWEGDEKEWTGCEAVH